MASPPVLTDDAVNRRMVQMLKRWRDDPLLFVQEAFPWGQAGTPLASFDGPDQWQVDTLTRIRDNLDWNKPLLLATSSGHGIGKEQPKVVELHTPQGKRRWGDLKVGDEVFGKDGKPTKIVGVHEQGVKPVFRVTFDDRSSTLAGAEHIWTLRGRSERRVDNGSGKQDKWRNMTTAEIMAAGAVRKNGAALARQWELPSHGAVEFPDAELPIEPYVLGLWIGNGGRNSGVVHTNDGDVLDQLMDRDIGYNAGSKQKTECIAAGLRGVRAKLREIGLLDTYSKQRFIPDAYKTASIDQRAELLRGLMDTDGECNKNGTCIYSTTSQTLADDVVWLARSLGGKARISPTTKMPFYNGPNGEKLPGLPCHRVTITMPQGFKTFYVERRQERVPANIEERYLRRWIDSIEPAGEEDCMCITVANEDGLYLTNDFIVTHNSCLVSWVTLWAMLTMVDTRGVITANTESQLTGKTWPEIAKWHRLVAFGTDMFTFGATRMESADKAHEKTWRMDQVVWSENRPEAFAGMHNKGRRLLVIFDEASAVGDVIWETTEGALTDSNTQIMWLVFGNPTRNTGRFRDCFEKSSHRWLTQKVDSRTASMTNKVQLEQWVRDYGEDSDFVRVRIRGEFPRAGTSQFIPSDLVYAGMGRDVSATLHDALVMGVDVARFGSDASIISFRRGRDAVSIPWVKLRGADTMEVAARVASLYAEHRPDAVFVDGGGVGGGVVDRLRMLKVPVIEVQFGAKSDRAFNTADTGTVYANKRAEMWGSMRDWLAGGAIPEDDELARELISVEYGYAAKDGRDAVLLEKKEDMRRRGLPSPDQADALAMTFAFPVAPSDHSKQMGSRKGGQHSFDYDPFADEWNQFNQPKGPTAGRQR